MNKEKNSETILVICIGLMVLFLIFKIKAFLTASLLIGLAGIFSDWLSAKITWAWLKLATILGEINGKILLSIVFFLILTPIALLMKMVGKVSFRIKKNNATTFYEERNHLYTASDIENIW